MRVDTSPELGFKLALAYYGGYAPGPLRGREKPISWNLELEVSGYDLRLRL